MSEAIHSIPAFSKRGEDAQGGCAFILRDLIGGLWLITVAHLPIWGKRYQGDVTADFSRWEPRIYLSPRYGQIIEVDIFEDAAKTLPKFKWAGSSADIGDVIALSLPKAALAKMPNVAVIDAKNILHGFSQGASVVLEGFPDGFLKTLDYVDTPKRSSGRMIDESLASYDGTPEDAAGFSGSPVLTDQGKFAGMFFGHGMGRMVLVPAAVITFLIHSPGSQVEHCPIYNVARINRTPNGVHNAA